MEALPALGATGGIMRDRESARRNLSAANSHPPPPLIIGRSPQIAKLLEEIRRLARAPGPKLITGETGTGKELIARALHAASDRRGPFIVVNCAVFTPELAESRLAGHEPGAFTGAQRRTDGAFREADGGTLFLDEFGELPPPVQAILLRMIDGGEVQRVGSTRTDYVDVQVLIATNRDVLRMVKEGTLREDLFMRVKGRWVKAPPLRSRRGDVGLLAVNFISALSTHDRPLVAADDLLEALEAYRWPGNVRELKEAIARAAAFCDDGVLRPEYLDPDILREVSGASETTPIDFGSDLIPLRHLIRQYIAHAWALTGGNISEMARCLRIDRATVARRLRESRIAEQKWNH